MFWLGLYRNKNGALTWTDGEAYEEWDGIPWDRNEPNENGGDCTRFQFVLDAGRKQGKWAMHPCDRAISYVCKAPSSVPVSCQNGFIEQSGQCWKILDEEWLTWTEANQLCENENSHLAEINSFEEDKGLSELLPKTEEQLNYWIGLKGKENDSPEMFTWQYSGETVRYSNWPISLDQSASIPMEQCTTVLTSDSDLYTWYPRACNWELGKAICQYNIGETCPKGWTRHEDRCYEFFITPEYRRSWREARSFCDQIGAELLTLKTVEYQKYITTHHSRLTKAGVRDYWIGASNVNDLDHLTWVDGDEVELNQFSEDAKFDPTQEQCVEALTAQAENNWHYQYCGQPRAFVCSAPLGAHIYIPDNVHQDYKCESGWHYFKDGEVENCYKMSEAAQTSSQARRRCQEIEAEMVSILTVEENEFVAHLLYNKHDEGGFLTGDAWLGLKTTEHFPTDSAVVDSTWSDTTPVNYTNFAPGSPAYDGGQFEGDCVFMFGTDSEFTGGWSNKACASPDQHGICKKRAKYDPNATSPPIIIHPDEEVNIKFCGSNSWKYDPTLNSCYHFTSHKDSWVAQQEHCDLLDGFLVSINSPEENEILNVILSIDIVG